MQHSILRIGFACLIAAVGSTAARSEPLADGTWTVIERCGENTVTKNPKLKQGFDRQTQMVVDKGHIAGHDRTVRKRDGAVTDLSYDGTTDGTKVTITGTGLRSDQKQPWTSSYEGTVTADGRAELTGALFMRMASSEQPVKLRACSLSFLTVKTMAGAAPAAAAPAQK